MRSTAAVDNLILWHVAGIFGLAWLIVAAVSLDGVRGQASYASLAQPVACEMQHGCDPSLRSSRPLDRR